MTWQVHQEGLILDGDRVVGSMMPVDTKTQNLRLRWRVEIIWSGPGGDIVYETEVHAAALAFVIGVEKAFKAFGRPNMDKPVVLDLSDPRPFWEQGK